MLRRLVFRNAQLYRPEGPFTGDLLIAGDRIVAVGLVPVDEGIDERDASGLQIVPGLVDLQVNGLAGADAYAATPEAVVSILRAAPRMGCTALLATLVSAPEPLYARFVTAVQSVLQSGRPEGGARLLGAHLEGPYLNPKYRGAHPPGAGRDPSLDEVRAILELADGSVKIWTLAPELPGAAGIIDLLMRSGVVVAAGHSALTYADARAWFERGVGLVSHLFNAMTPMHHREPGLPGAALADTRVHFTLIADGRHVHPAFIHLLSKLARERLILITDAIVPAGAPAGRFMHAGREVITDGEVASLLDGTIAGSTLPAIEAVMNFQRWAQLPFGDALAAMTSRPADLIGRSDLGRLAPGCAADFLLLDAHGRLQETWVAGELAYSSGAILARED